MADLISNSGSTNKKIIFENIPCFWANVVTNNVASPVVGGSGARLIFDCITDGSFKDLITATSRQASENTDIACPNNILIRFEKPQIIIDGTDDTKTLTDPTKDPHASKRGEVTVTISAADVDSTTWSNMLQTIRTHREDLWFLCFPVGMTYEQAYQSTGTGKIDSFYYMLGKINSDLENKLSSSPATISLTFVSYEFYSASSALTVDNTLLQTTFSTDCWNGVAIKGTSRTVTPPALTTTEALLVGQGEVVNKIPS